VDALQPRAARHYPRSAGEFQAWFRTDADCLDYLDWLRWPAGFACPRCRYPSGWADEKKEIVRKFFSNLTFDGQKLRFDAAKPFDEVEIGS
jgi:hypothetical protein